MSARERGAFAYLNWLFLAAIVVSAQIGRAIDERRLKDGLRAVHEQTWKDTWKIDNNSPDLSMWVVVWNNGSPDTMVLPGQISLSVPCDSLQLVRFNAPLTTRFVVGLTAGRGKYQPATVSIRGSGSAEAGGQ